jgi:hypothetical protein
VIFSIGRDKKYDNIVYEINFFPRQQISKSKIFRDMFTLLISTGVRRSLPTTKSFISLREAAIGKRKRKANVFNGKECSSYNTCQNLILDELNYLFLIALHIDTQRFMILLRYCE